MPEIAPGPSDRATANASGLAAPVQAARLPVLAGERPGDPVSRALAAWLTKQMVEQIPMTPGRKKEWGKMLFHNLRRFAEPMKADFDVDFTRGLKTDDVEFMARMFFRRHVYEHNGGEVDQKYVDDSGDTTVRLKQVIRESAESASRTCDLALKMSRNLHAGFHEIFPAEEMPLRIHQDEVARRRAST